ncbi:hypothetical protein BN6_31100 [Saccharothrix espanaensis DSM 44229]|uniref:Uncharacterized protein n=1 Tax=Saccharothrix espanaensis (strain ATCC 51144 / DSM 44229 / JCM 9112 / NBRC 15066 / NRRL 15764) TaxID=1179773 RepID=K0JRW1_SACES|nr:hypothetical protein BN6_31100 [Saccharothrix espanaensis DSM 44229]
MLPRCPARRVDPVRVAGTGGTPRHRPHGFGVRASLVWRAKPKWANCCTSAAGGRRSQSLNGCARGLDDRYRAATVYDDGWALDRFHRLNGPDLWCRRRRPGRDVTPATQRLLV